MFSDKYFNALLREARQLEKRTLYISLLVTEEEYAAAPDNVASPEWVKFDADFFKEISESRSLDEEKARCFKLLSLMRSKFSERTYGPVTFRLQGYIGRLINEIKDEPTIYFPIIKKMKKAIVDQKGVSILYGNDKRYSFDPWEIVYVPEKGVHYREIEMGFLIDIVSILKEVRRDLSARTILREDSEPYLSLSKLIDKKPFPYGNDFFFRKVGELLLCEVQEKYEFYLKNAYEENHLILIEPDGEERQIAYADSEGLFEDAAKVYCFSDCCDEAVKEIVFDGKQCFYCGWQPNMLYEFVDEDGNKVFSAYYPDWDH